MNNPATDGKIEPRANPNHDPKSGRFTTGVSENKSSESEISGTEIQDRISKVKEFMTEQTENLSDEQKEILTRYTGNLATQINTHIKLGTAERKYSKEMELLDSSLKDGIMPEAATLHRVTSMSFLNIGVDNDTLKNNMEDIIGKVVKNPIYTSTSFESIELHGRDTEMRISVPKGFKGCQYLKPVAYPKFKAQEEVLFKRGLEYVIMDAKYQNEKFILDVEVISYER